MLGKKINYIIVIVFIVVNIAVIGFFLLYDTTETERGYIGFFLLYDTTETERGYSAAQVAAGEAVFTKNCMVCHGARGESSANWSKPDANGAYPPPPLNGTAHTWHHPLAALKQTIKKGGVPLGGQMPAFESTLSEEEIDNVIFYIQSLWSDEIYETWLTRVEKRNLIREE